VLLHVQAKEIALQGMFVSQKVRDGKIHRFSALIEMIRAFFGIMPAFHRNFIALRY
jgi:hypothetical protein